MDPAAHFRGHAGLFVAGRPENDAGTVSVPPDQGFQLLHRLVIDLEPPGLVHDQKAHFIQGVHRGRAVLVVAGAEAVGAHFLVKLDLIAGHVVRHGQTRQAEVLMGADAVDLYVTAVEEQSLLRRNRHRPESDAGGIRVNGRIAGIQGGFHGIQHRGIDIPQLRILHRGGVAQGQLVLGLHGALPGSHGDCLAALVQNPALRPHRARRIIRIENRCLKGDLPGMLPRPDRRRIDAIQINGDLIRGYQPHIPVNTTSLVPPALELLGIDIHRQNIFLTEAQVSGNIDLEAVVGREIVLQQAAIEVNGRSAGNAVKLECHPLVKPPFVYGKVLPIPGVVIMKIAVGVVFRRAVVLIDDVIVGKIHHLPEITAPVDILIVAVRLIPIEERGGAYQLSFGFALHIDGTLVRGTGNGNIPLVEMPIPGQQLDFSHVTAS